jgi:biopolymer transport protein ExbD
MTGGLARVMSGVLLLCSGCGGNALFDTSGGQLDVTVLPGAQVSVGGERMPREQFLLAVRQQVRALDGDRAAAPVVALRAELGVPSGEIDLLLRELRNAGIWRVNLGS